MTPDGSFLPIMKLSKDKITLPGRKQVYRFKNEEGSFKKDLIALSDEKVNGEPLLVKVIERGKLIEGFPTINEIRVKAADNLSKLPAEFKALTNAPVYSVELSQKLQNLIETTKSLLIKNEVNKGSS
jgi:nicotinate phosphoribosyltransferase